MEWIVTWPKVVAEDDRVSVKVTADTIEEAIIEAERVQHDRKPHVGQVYNVSARVEVMGRTPLPLKSV